MHDHSFSGPAVDFTNLGSADLLAEAKSLDTLISNLEVEAFRLASSGMQARSMAATRRARELKGRRTALLRALNMRNLSGAFGDFGAPPKKKAAPEVKAMREAAFRKRAAAERKIFDIEKRLSAFAKKVQGKAIASGAEDVRANYLEMAKSARDYVEASGAVEVIQSGNLLRRQAGERDGIQMLLGRYSRFFDALPKKLPRNIWEAFSGSHSAYRTVLTRMSRPRAVGAERRPITTVSCVPNTKCGIVVGRLSARPKRTVSATKLKNVKKTILLRQGARIPDPIVMRIIAQRIATRYPRPKTMDEVLYADLIMELTKRAAVHTANAQAAGTPTDAAVKQAAETVVKEDLPAVKEEVTTGVSAPAGEQVAAAAVQSAAAQVVQGAADAGSIPSVPAASTADQTTVAQVAASPDPAAAAAAVDQAAAPASAGSGAGVVTDMNIEAAFSVSPTDGSASVSQAGAAPATTDSLPEPEAIVESAGAGSGTLEESTPFYKRPVVLAVGALALVGGYMYLRSRNSAGAVPGTPSSAAE